MSKKMSIKVAIVEDDSRARMILAEWISQAEGFNCVADHGSVEEALADLPARNPSVVLMDINLPKLSGVEGVRRLKPLLPETQFVMLTVYEDADHVFDALAAGASGYLMKQTSRLELLSSIKEVHDGGSPMTGHIARKVVQAFQKNRSAGAASPGAAKLTPRERELLELLARGYLYKEIMDALKISLPTVNCHIRNIYEKLHVHSRSQAVALFSQFSLDKPQRLSE
jgi:DNA-binding NarL/FixJ family response regulator